MMEICRSLVSRIHFWAFAFKPLEIVLTCTFFFLAMYLGYYCYIHLPLVDFLPYKVGVNIREAMQAPVVEPGESETVLVYRNRRTGREREFWIWCASWGLFLQKPSDLGFSDDGYSLPPMDIRYHKLNSLDRPAEFEADGQMKLGHDAAMGLSDAAKEKRDSIDIRAAEVARIIAEAPPDEHFVVWHDLEDERKALKKAVPEMVDIYGSMELETREQRVMDFAQGRTRIFGTKKSLSGSGCNFQRHCHRAIFMGIDYEFNDFIQAIHRIYRFLQKSPVIIDILYMDTETEVLLALAILLGGLIVWKHRGNLKRILNGTESKFSLHHKKDEGAPKA